MKLVAEQCTVISISSLQKEIRKTINKDNPEASEEDIYNFTVKELDAFNINGHHFKYTYIKNVLGGYRWFFLCDKCGSRIQKLYLPPKAYINYQHDYFCKECHGLLNESVMKSKNNLYKKVIRPLQKLREIENRLERGHLTSEKIDEYLNEYDRIEQELKNSSQYRHYAFKKKRGLIPR